MGCQQNKPLWAATWSTLPHIPADTHLKGGVNLNNYFISLHKTSWDLQWAVLISRLLGLNTPAHKFQPGNWVYCKDWGTSLLQSKILHHTAPDDTSCGSEEIRTKLSSWLSSWTWLKHLFITVCHYNNCYVCFSLLVLTCYAIKWKTDIKRLVPIRNLARIKGGTG